MTNNEILKKIYSKPHLPNMKKIKLLKYKMKHKKQSNTCIFEINENYYFFENIFKKFF